MSERLANDPPGIIAGQYEVDLTRPLPDAGGGVPAFAAVSQRSSLIPLMALRVDRHASARPRPLQVLQNGIDGLLTPLAQGLGPPIDGHPAWFVICAAPRGEPLSASLRPWPEHQLLELVLRPIALVLDQLQSRGVTHRGIRLDNVFHGAPNRPVTLGAAWSAPPAMHQPALYETAYTAVCHPAARGDGRISDDVYALGVLLATLALGRLPMEGLDAGAIMRRKLEFGDFNAIAGNERLTPMLGDIIRGMLAEDPDHRPSPALLRDPAGARGRRVAARPASRAQRSFRLGASTVWNTRTLALAMAHEPDEAANAIHSGAMMYWLRRGLGDSNLAVRLEELVRQHAQDMSTQRDISQAMLTMRAIADVDGFMPLCWRGLAIFPDGLGPALATSQQAEPDLHRRLTEIVLSEAQGIWAGMREESTAEAPHRLEARQRRAILQIKGPAGGLPRLSYTLNAQTPCVSPLLNDRWIISVRELPPALNAIAQASPDSELMDANIAAFIGARSERRLDQEVKALGDDTDPGGQALTTLRLLTELQARYHPAPLPGLTAWVTARGKPLIERWQNRERRGEVEERLKTLATEGFLFPILSLLEDHADHAADSEGLRVAVAELARLDKELGSLAEGGGRRSAIAARMGQEIAAGMGLAAVAITLVLAALG